MSSAAPDEPLPPRTLLAAMFRTWGPMLPWITVALAVCCAPAVWWMRTRGFGWPVVGLLLAGEAIAWTLVTPRAIGVPGFGIRAVPRVVATLALAYAPILGIALGVQFGSGALRDLFGAWMTIALVLITIPLGALMLATDLHARWMVVVPLIVDRGQGLNEAAKLTAQHRSALHGALIAVGAIWLVVLVIAMTFTMKGSTIWNWRGFPDALVYAWLIISTLRAALAAGVYQALRAWWNPADLGKVFE